MTYNSDLSTVNIRCLASEEDSVMAKCQTLMDGIVRRELNGDSVSAISIALSGAASNHLKGYSQASYRA
ncbi:hypothetical protein F5B19DRAFT_452012 [Rostrohypoxylon terebratum]|nr:hypothetical protein F5B19DRAFT_452012 [Rostrohypoxylon terebratum]